MDSSKDLFLIYQLKHHDDYRSLRFEPLDRIRANGLFVERSHYNHLYTGTIEQDVEPQQVLDTIFQQFNTSQPPDFAGHSLSISDVVVLIQNGVPSAFYVDVIGFTEVPEFLDAPYLYYSIRRPIDIGTFPRTDGGPIHVQNYDWRTWVENSTLRVWGFLEYTMPLTEEHLQRFELHAASGNPDKVRLSPYQLAEQIQAIGEWEHSNRVHEISRQVWWHSDIGVFVKKDRMTDERIADRFNSIIESKTRQLPEVSCQLEVDASTRER